MKYFLAKTEPLVYSIEDFKRNKKTTWDGVKSAQAVNYIKQMKIGDKVLIYHSGGECKIRGVGEVISNPRPDEREPRSWVFEIKFLKEIEPITLKEIKESREFSDFRLVYQSRLSTMEVPDKFIKYYRLG